RIIRTIISTFLNRRRRITYINLKNCIFYFTRLFNFTNEWFVLKWDFVIDWLRISKLYFFTQPFMFWVIVWPIAQNRLSLSFIDSYFAGFNILYYNQYLLNRLC